MSTHVNDLPPGIWGGDPDPIRTLSRRTALQHNSARSVVFPSLIVGPGQAFQHRVLPGAKLLS